jgi:hypothetical protein
LLQLLQLVRESTRASLAAGSVIEKFLCGTQVVDPPVILGVVTLLAISAAAAAFVPAKRATSINPMDALRAE